MGGEFVPQLEEGDFAVETRLLWPVAILTIPSVYTTGITYTAERVSGSTEKIVTKIGSAEIPTDPMPFDGWYDGDIKG